MSSKLIAKFLSASLLIAGIGILARVFGLLKELAIADAFGLSESLDQYYLAVMVPMFLVTVLTNPLASSFIPRYNVLKKEDATRATRFYNSVFSVLFIVLCAFSCLFLLGFLLMEDKFMVFSKQLFLSGLLLGLLVLIQGMSNHFLAILEHKKQFVYTALGGVFSSTFIILLIYLVPSISIILYGLVLGSLVFTLMLFGVLQNDNSTRLSFNFEAIDLTFKKEYAFLFLGSLFMGSTFLVDQLMAEALGAESVSALNYGFRLISLFTGLATLAIGKVALPYFSNLKVEQDFKSINELLQRILLLVFVGPAAVILGIWFYGEWFVSLVLERGAFNADDTNKVQELLLYYSFQLPFYVGGVVLVRLVSVFQQNKRVLMISGSNMVLNVALNYWLIQVMGLAGIALSTSLVYFCSFVLLWLTVRKALATKLN